MCTWNAGSSPWNLLHFIGVGLTAFSYSTHVINGVAEVLIHVLMILLCVAPLLFVQLKLGRLLQRSLYGLFNTSFPFYRGVAVMVMVRLLIECTHYSSYPVQKICAGFTLATADRGVMRRCDNAWNTPLCEKWTALNTSNSASVSRTYATAFDEYFENEFLQKTDSADDLGGFAGDVPVFPLALLVTWIFVFLMVGFGPRVFGWASSLVGLAYVVTWICVLWYGWYERFNARWILREYYSSKLFDRIKDVLVWHTGLSAVGRLSVLWFGILPTMGKFAGNGKITRNVTWIVVILEVILLEHFRTLGFAAYRDNPSISGVIDVEQTMKSLVYRNAPPAVAFFVFFAMYIQETCALALFVVVIVDNCMEIFDWLLTKRQWNRRVVWLITSGVLCMVLLLLGIPFTTRGGWELRTFVWVSVYQLDFLTVCFVVPGLLGVYLWQNVAVAERLAIGIWCVLVGPLFVVVHVLLVIWRSLSTSQWWERMQKWDAWVISAIPLAFLLMVIIIDAIQFTRKSRQRSVLEWEEMQPHREAGERAEDREEHAVDNPENVESSFE